MPRHNLPAQLTSFIGREREIAEVRRFLSTTRLLTLTGAGGAGKSRLAFQVAAEALDDFADGVWTAELAPIADPTLVAQAVASALDVPEQPGRPLTDTLADYLRSRSLLLVLDNCEHLRTACAALATALLQGSPGLRILATSRVPLTVPGEVLWRVPSLSVPEARPRSPDEIRHYEAVRLFVERARAVQPAFALTSDNARAVADVCRELDGIPLAIELAAARTRVLAVGQIAERLHDRFRLLTGGSPSALPRHQTLQATMDWSYGLLAAHERTLLGRLSVFAGGWSLEAAEAVCADGGLERTEVLDVLAHLVDNSLVLADMPRDETRYRLLETVRQYAQARLEDSDEAVRVRRRHRDWYLGLAERADASVRGPDEETWLALVETEHDNLRAAIEWTKAQRDAEAELRLARALEWFWYLLGHWTEGRARLEEAIERGAAAPPSYMPKILVGVVRLAYRMDDLRRAEALCTQGLTLTRQLDDKSGTAQFLLWSGIIAVAENRPADAVPRVEEALAVCRAIGDRWWELEALAMLGTVATMRGDYPRAGACLTECLTLSRETGNANNTSYALRGLGVLAVRRGDAAGALVHYTECLDLCRRVRTPGIIAECFEGLARTAALRREHERAAVLFGAADALFQSLGGRLPLWADESEHDRHVAAARSKMGPAAFAAADGRGRAMTVDQALEYALPPAPPGRTPRDAEAETLTAREREVASLVAQGLTNRQVAARLVVTERTAETHVQNILNKLGFTSRAQIAAWAVAQGLLPTA
ncbi:MAG TPA: LuxR C-terminal-related transcriptional regulator [bacterium]|nr:LuxR C-terminal-related transcriptional regulator [bacterium]